MTEFLVWNRVLLLPSRMVPPIWPGLCSGMSMTWRCSKNKHMLPNPASVRRQTACTERREPARGSSLSVEEMLVRGKCLLMAILKPFLGECFTLQPVLLSHRTGHCCPLPWPFLPWYFGSQGPALIGTDTVAWIRDQTCYHTSSPID